MPLTSSKDSGVISFRGVMSFYEIFGKFVIVIVNIQSFNFQDGYHANPFKFVISVTKILHFNFDIAMICGKNTWTIHKYFSVRT